jgi:hypothetical protein
MVCPSFISRTVGKIRINVYVAISEVILVARCGLLHSTSVGFGIRHHIQNTIPAYNQNCVPALKQPNILQFHVTEISVKQNSCILKYTHKRARSSVVD